MYRVKQSWQALFPRLRPADRAWLVAQNLPESAYALFKQQSPVEQRHALDTAYSLAGLTGLNRHEQRTLIIAALLHDCGKSTVSLHIWHRVLAVLCAMLPKHIYRQIADGHGPLSFTLTVAVHHPEWGEKLARQAQLSDDVCLLIRQHHNPQTKLGHLLHQADCEH